MKKLIMLVLLFAVGLTSAYANDSAVETAAGGLKLRKERSVLMEKERLFISENLVRVEYEFRNTTKSTVSSEVAFPIPPYEYVFEHDPPSFEDFKASVDGKPIKVKKEVRAFVKGHEVTEDLRSAGITIENFGKYEADENPANNKDEIAKLKPEVLSKLVKVGALDAPGSPNWEAHIKYYWHQEFPPGKVVRIKHEYRPVWGFSPANLDTFNEESSKNHILKGSCMDADTRREIERRIKPSLQKDPWSNGYFSVLWVSYILTTANAWQTPIKDFELIIQRDKDELVTFCWDGPVENLGDGKFRAHKNNFIPEKDLKIYFLKNF